MTFDPTRDPYDPTFIIAQNKALDIDVEPEEVVMLNNLPTADPHVAGQAWNNAGTVKISAG